MKRALAAAAIAAAFILAFAFTPPRGPRSIRRFEPDRLADLEVRMWQAYYGQEKVRLFALLVTTLHEQYRYSWATAAEEGFHLARAAATFGELRGNYDQVLPDLEQAYGTARRGRGSGPGSIREPSRAPSSRGGWRAGFRDATARSRWGA